MEPFSIGFSKIASAIRAYSSGRPMRFGNAASLVSPVLHLLGDAARETGLEQARRDRHHAHAEAAEIAGHREGHAGDAGLGRRVGDLSDLPLEGGDRRRHR